MIQEHIKKPLADEMLFGKLVKGGLVQVLVQDGEIVLKDRAGRASAHHREEAAAADRRIGSRRRRNDKARRTTGGPFLAASGLQIARISLSSSTRSTSARSEPRLRMPPSMPITAYWPCRPASRGRFSMR